MLLSYDMLMSGLLYISFLSLKSKLMSSTHMIHLRMRVVLSISLAYQMLNISLNKPNVSQNYDSHAFFTPGGQTPTNNRKVNDKQSKLDF